MLWINQSRGIMILPVAEEQEQSLTRGGQSGGITDQPQCRVNVEVEVDPECHRSPSSPPPSFTQSPSPPRVLVRDGQTSPHTGLGSSSLVAHVLHYPPGSPHANSFIIGTAVNLNGNPLCQAHARHADGRARRVGQTWLGRGKRPKSRFDYITGKCYFRNRIIKHKHQHYHHKLSHDIQD
jgi:hypothetical protein